MVPLSVLGLHLAKKDSTWKEKYKIKKLNDLVDKCQDYIKIEGQGVQKTVGIR